MKLIYSNFDKVEVSFQGILPENILNQLSEAKDKAQNENHEIYAELGPNKFPVTVRETGSRNGYRYSFNTELDGEIWFIKHSSKSDKHNIRVSVTSMALAIYGYEAVKQRLFDRLTLLGASGSRHYTSASCEAVSDLPIESVSRFDYCFDFLDESGFEPHPNRFVAHQRCKKHLYTAGRGDRTGTVRIGEMPGRQAIIYDKTEEILASKKHYWWDIWGLNLDDIKRKNARIWRVEIRAGKDELANKWNLKRYEDFEKRAGDIVVRTLKNIRYTVPQDHDTNRSRWPTADFWQEAIDKAAAKLESRASDQKREKIISDYRENVVAGYEERIFGNFIGLAAAREKDVSDLPAVWEDLQKRLDELTPEEKNIMAEKHARAQDRMRMLR